MENCVFSPDIEAYYQDIEADFLRYLNDTGQQLYLVCKESTDLENLQCKKCDYAHRWSKTYKNRFLARLCLLQDWYLLNPYKVTFMTLTTYQERDMLIEDQITLLKESWDKLLKVLRRLRPGLDYFANMDFHKTGYSHYHVILFCSLKKSEEKKIREIWNKKYQAGHRFYGVNFQVRMRDNINYLISYVLKHSSKVLHSDSKTPGFLRFHSVVWHMGRMSKQKEPGVNVYSAVRLFSVSRRLSSIMKLPESDEHALRVVHMGIHQTTEQYLFTESDEYNDEIWFNFEKKNSKRKTAKAVKFFCDLDFD